MRDKDYPARKPTVGGNYCKLLEVRLIALSLSKVDANLRSPNFERLDPSSLVEEETLRGYRAKHCYPVRIGQIFNDCYEVIGKLGYGSASTVWLGRDLHKENEHVALNVYIHSSKFRRELPIYEHINTLRSEHGGSDRVRKFLESFEIEGPHGKHICLVHQPLGISLADLRELTPEGFFGLDLIKQTLRDLLGGLQFLHEEAHVIHTGELNHSNKSIVVADTE